MLRKESQMNDMSRIDYLVRQAQVQRSQYLGELIANAIFAAWTGMKRLGASLAAPAAKHRDVLGVPDPR
jgi:hypothetical protein